MKSLTVLIIIICAIIPTKVQAEKFDTKLVVDAYYKQNDTTSGVVFLTIKEGWHVNANPSSLEFLIPTEITVPDKPKSIDVSYPEGHKVVTPLGELKVYSEEISIPFLIKSGEMPEVVSLTAQACDGQTCYPPSTWTLPLQID